MKSKLGIDLDRCGRTSDGLVMKSWWKRMKRMKYMLYEWGRNKKREPRRKKCNSGWKILWIKGKGSLHLKVAPSNASFSSPPLPLFSIELNTHTSFLMPLVTMEFKNRIWFSQWQSNILQCVCYALCAIIQIRYVYLANVLLCRINLLYFFPYILAKC